ncbi:MAG: hypothetical protein ABEH35_08055 [Haloarculaceae archaeon]
MADFEQLLRDQRLNTALAWFLVVAVVVAVGINVASGNLLWAGFTTVVAVLALLPPVSLRNPSVMLPWEILALSALPVLGRAFATVPVTGRIATYLSVAALALIVAIELHLFTPVRMNQRFAVLFVVVTTLAAAGVWAVVRWLADIYLGTAFLLDPTLEEAVIHHNLMVEFTASTAAGIVAGIVCSLYVSRRIEPDVRLPEELPR